MESVVAVGGVDNRDNCGSSEINNIYGIPIHQLPKMWGKGCWRQRI